MTAPGQVLIATSVLPAAIIYGTDVFPAIVPRPALALVDDRTLVSIMGRGHDVGGPEAARARRRRARRRHTGNCSDRLGGHLAATVASAIAVVALACCLIIYARISAPINSLPAAAPKAARVPPACCERLFCNGSGYPARLGLVTHPLTAPEPGVRPGNPAVQTCLPPGR